VFAPFLSAASRDRAPCWTFLVEESASTIVLVATFRPLAARCRCTEERDRPRIPWPTIRRKHASISNICLLFHDLIDVWKGHHTRCELSGDGDGLLTAVSDNVRRHTYCFDCLGLLQSAKSTELMGVYGASRCKLHNNRNEPSTSSGHLGRAGPIWGEDVSARCRRRHCWVTVVFSY
jgi:hypothetical protein